MNGIRMPNLNVVYITGRLTRDPELRYTQNGVAVFNGRLASNSFYRAADGEWKKDTTYTGFVAWQALAERCYENLKKGSAVLVHGRLNSDEWETAGGEKRYQLDIRADRVSFLDRTTTDHPDASEESAEREEEMEAVKE
ncbi:single-stranded DNA-binding protein [Candidatus Zixiibacteriota bacterium]